MEWKHLIRVEDGCWFWEGPTRDGVPVLPRADRLRDSGQRRARSEMLRACGYEEPVSGAWLMMSCGHDLCVRPDHVQIRERPKRETEARTFQPRAWTLKDIQGFKRAHDAGYSWRAIGKEKGLSGERVRQLVDRYEANLRAEGTAGAS
jgi:hypothetical protein